MSLSVRQNVSRHPRLVAVFFSVHPLCNCSTISKPLWMRNILPDPRLCSRWYYICAKPQNWTYFSRHNLLISPLCFVCNQFLSWPWNSHQLTTSLQLYRFYNTPWHNKEFDILCAWPQRSPASAPPCDSWLCINGGLRPVLLCYPHFYQQVILCIRHDFLQGWRQKTMVTTSAISPMISSGVYHCSKLMLYSENSQQTLARYAW